MSQSALMRDEVLDRAVASLLDASWLQRWALAIHRGQVRRTELEIRECLETALYPEVPCPLTTPELNALRELATGKTYKQIACDLGRQASTIRTHMHHIYEKLEVPDRAQAVLLAVRNGWI